MSLWKPYVPSEAMPWDLRRAKHLHRRAAFGATWSELQRDVKDGAQASINRVLSGKSRIHGLRNDFEELSTIIGDAAVASNDSNRLKAWWLFRICFTPDPLREKLTILWHNHFATSNQKVRDLQLMRNQNNHLRSHATGKFGDILHGVLHDPAMIVWLDAGSNRAGHPNENLARESMELFTLGVANYTEDDVKEAARALTGWSAKHDRVRFREERHDLGEKTILGETAAFDASSYTDLLLKQKATSRRLAWRLCNVLMGENVASDEAINELATGLRQHKLDIGWAVETILRSELFFSDENIASRVSSPIEFVVSAVRALEQLEDPPSTLVLAEWCSRLGEDLFYPPNVGGWKGGRSWLTSRTIVGRSNFAAALVSGELWSPPLAPNFETITTKDRNDVPKKDDPFQALLLSVSCEEQEWKRTESTAEKVAQLLSSPEAQLT